MAPENVPSVVVFNSRIENDVLLGKIEYIEPKSEGQRIRVRWAVEQTPNDFEPIGDGVAYVYNKNQIVDFVPISTDAAPSIVKNTPRYQWTEGLQFNCPWVMFILILPKGYTISDPQPEPHGTKIFNGRLAIYWMLQGDDINRTRVEWDMPRLKCSLEKEILKINKIFLDNKLSKASTISVEDSTFSPIPWAFAIIIVLIFSAVSYRIVTSCEKSSFNLLNKLKIELGGCNTVPLIKTTESIKNESVEPPPSLQPETVTNSYDFSMVGLEKLSGEDCEMDTDPQDTVKVNFKSTITHTESEVVLVVSYDAEEYKGNNTKIGDTLSKVIYQPPTGKKIIRIEFQGPSIVNIRDFGAQGRNHGYRSFGDQIANSYWETLSFKVDDSGSNDCAAAGVKGSLSYTAILLPTD